MPEKLQLLSGNKVYTDTAIDTKFKTEPNFFIVDRLPDADSPLVQPNAIYYKKLPLDPNILEGYCFIRGVDEYGRYEWRRDVYTIVDALPEDLEHVSENTVYKLSSDDDKVYICDTNDQDEKVWFVKDLVLVTRLPDVQDVIVADDTVYKLKVTINVPSLIAYVLGVDKHGNKCWYTDGDSKANIERNYLMLSNKPSINGEVIQGNMDKTKATAAVSEDGVSGGYNLSLSETEIRNIVASVFGN